VDDPLKSLGTSDPPRALDTDTAGPTPDAVVRCFKDMHRSAKFQTPPNAVDLL